MKTIFRPTTALAPLFLLATGLGFTPIAQADSGAYVGGSVGRSDLDVGCCGADDSAWKVFGGYNFDVTFINLAVEAEYVDFGSYITYNPYQTFENDVDALAGFGVAGLDLGFIGFFGKAGLANWDSGGQDGTDPAYGIGARLTFGSVEVRAEYEYFDIDSYNLSDLSLLSIGAAWTF